MRTEGGLVGRMDGEGANRSAKGESGAKAISVST